jgi:hypothetical protein
MSPSLGLGDADVWRAFAGSSLINAPAANQTSTGSCDCHGPTDDQTLLTARFSVAAAYGSVARAA